MKIHELVEQLIRQNPELGKKTAYLMLEVWDRQGLKLHPIQREMFMDGKLAAAESITRASRKAKIKLKKEREALKTRYNPVHVKVQQG